MMVVRKLITVWSSKGRWFVTSIAAMLLLLASIPFFATQAGKLPDRYVQMPENGYFGRMSKVLFDANATDTTIATDMIIREVFGVLGMKSEIIVYDDKNKLKSDLANNRIDAIFINTIDFLEMQNLIDMHRLYSLVYGERAEQTVLLLVRESDSIDSISGLHGKEISIPAGHFLGRTYLDVLLMESDYPTIDQYFTTVHETIDTNSAIVDLFFNKTDAALVSDIAFELASELNPRVRTNLKPLAESQAMIPQIIGLNKNISEKNKARIDGIMSKTHENKRIKHLLSLFRANKFIKLNQSEIRSTQQLIDRYNQLLQSR
ncbi:MAG: phosphate/phosphite/phosphonate ABC transporter substrate-binding protein [Candidatus Thiodiazotropha taylori]|nr:phosphate/phosphite/phosphonate ABC transporter substrate-binding protein [Candidatus Thiodiazotropha taylori]MCG8079717.1 phosphate/phosphite/phosphonate ABC transporter substrate-binding protein [Candidatus Thiodiazotropha taylori]MCG8105620.1 phosphate/phosphite/phosphonate ABC transporter substrate-binding protein [Candidatus Thiodiazotropha taylori]MCG8111144.1 phosphate/phosphite/phosphonate ABC transporter substrate-binding protein [Candidatus Thiodiazotropha taylori]MCW4277957.1 phos